MFAAPVPRGAVFHADSKRRREVEFTPELRAMTEEAVRAMHDLMAHERVPPAEFRPACEECSLFERCLPRVTANGTGLGRVERALFEV
jgi:CRISPR-associated exonuclease Cas4